MSWFRQSHGAKPDYTGLQLQTSASTLPIPIVWGQGKLAPNVIWYANFRTQAPSTGGKGGYFSTGAASGSEYTYTADLVLALSEGPIASIGHIWKDQSTYSLTDLGLSLFGGTTPQATWGYLTASNPTEALAYQGTAYVAAASYALGTSATVGNHNFEIVGIFAGTGANGVDADPAQVISDFLTNPQYGVGFGGTSINAATLFGSGGDASLQTYCRAAGLAISPVLTTQETASSILARWLQLLNCAAVWSAGQLKFIPYGDAAIAAGDVARSTQVVIPPAIVPSSGATPPPTVIVCAAGQFVADGGVVYAFNGAALTSVGAATPSRAGTYGISPAGQYLFAAGDVGTAVVISYTYAIPVSYTPNLTPAYNLSDYDYVAESGTGDPLEVSRVDPFSLPTILRLECLSRNNQYSALPVEARDQSQIEIYGPRIASTIQAHEICDEVGVGAIVAQTLLQRQLYVRASFTFTLSWEYGLLEPMDIVTLTDANLGLSAYPVRIRAIEENERGLLRIEAEELALGLATAAVYTIATPQSLISNQGATASAVNAPLIYEPPPALTGGAAQIWLGASGASGNASWGGANVWVSLDGVTYSQAATISAPLRQGVLTAALPSAAGWDSVDTLAVSLAMSGGALSGTSATGASQGVTLALVDSELLAYQSATLTGAASYALTGLQRGLDGSPPATHASGAPFARLDSAIVKYQVPAGYIGQTLNFKFQSFNVFGAGLQSLAACTAYTYQPTGAGALGPVAAALAAGTSLDYGLASSGVSESDDFGNFTAPYVTSIDLGKLAS